MNPSNSLPTASFISRPDTWMLRFIKSLKFLIFFLIRQNQIGTKLFIIFLANASLISKENESNFPKTSPGSIRPQIVRTPISRKNIFRLSYRMGYFRPNDEIMREIYHKGISYQGEFNWNFWKGFNFFSNVDFFSNSGRSLNFNSNTRVRIIGWTNGFSYLYKWAPWIGWYAGFGPKTFFYHNEDRAPYVTKNISRNTVGFGTKSGLMIFPSKWLFFDLFIDYSYGKIHFHSRRSNDILRFSTNAGGLTVGGGMGARF